jgi:hypothetical protein
MIQDPKLAMISTFEASYSLVDELIEGYSREVLLFVPPIRDAWSINDFLVHFLDADISLAFRVRMAMAEPGKPVPVWDENAWHDSLHYDEMDGLDCLAQAKGIRRFVASSLRLAVDSDWSTFTIEHPVKGRMDLADILSLYERHIVFHLPLIRRNLREWSEKGSML